MRATDWVEVSAVDIVFSHEAASIIMGNDVNEKHFLIHVSIETGSLLLNLFQKQHFKRPDTFTLLVNAVTSLGGAIESIRINDMINGVFFAKIVLRRGNNLVTLDARASDAIALSVIDGVPIQAPRALLEKISWVDTQKANAHNRAKNFVL
ncbi:MAG: bifunctional nuclease family protein [Opitutales bacterium]|nr:bifunctional nuclease family protein [Opitutales bacterium]